MAGSIHHACRETFIYSMSEQYLRETSIIKLLRCTKPIYEDLRATKGTDEYCFLGSGFTAKFHDRWYFVTAGHVVPAAGPQNLRVFDPDTNNALPFRRFNGRKSASDRDD